MKITSLFSSIRAFLWPIHTSERATLLPMLFILVCTILSQTIIRNLKDALIITESGGAAIIPFIKLWVVFPAAVVAIMLFSYCLNHFSRPAVFQGIILCFMSFFLLFCFVIYPNREFLHPSTTADWLESLLPIGCKGLIAMYRHWTLTCFYVLAELWSSLVLQVLVWGFINEITTVDQASRFYGVMVIAANIATISAGQISVALSSSSATLSPDQAWQSSLNNLMLFIIGLCIVSLIAFQWLRPFFPQLTPQPNKPAKHKLSFFESLQCLAQSKYLLSIAGIVFSYNMIINLVDVLWKDRLCLLYPFANDYNIYINHVTTITGIISTIASCIFVGLIHRLGWTATAFISPIILAITSVAFFSSLLFGEALTQGWLHNTSLLGLTVFLGSLQTCCSKAAKYSVFDATKEMAFVPLDVDEKMKGKSAIDGIGSRMAKSGSSCIQQGLLILCGSLTASAPYIAMIIICILITWAFSIRYLGSKIKTHT